MKLPPKPSTRGRNKSDGSTSTQPADQEESPIWTPTPVEQSSSEDQPQQAEDTPSPEHGQKSNLLLVAPRQIRPIEQEELVTLGWIFSHLPWLNMETSCIPFIKGMLTGNGITQPPQIPLNHYDSIIYYLVSPAHTNPSIISLDIRNLHLLVVFVDEAMKELYKLGIID